VLPLPAVSIKAQWAARLGALCYIAWGLFHLNVAHDIYILGFAQTGIAQGRLYQLAAYMLCIAMFAIAVAAFGNWRNNERGYWLNICVVGWADGVWVLVVVLPGYVPLVRGLAPPALFVAGAIFTTIARHAARKFPGIAI
jgi:small-conductance mechanosensitive channel